MLGEVESKEDGVMRRDVNMEKEVLKRLTERGKEREETKVETKLWRRQTKEEERRDVCETKGERGMDRN